MMTMILIILGIINFSLQRVTQQNTILHVTFFNANTMAVYICVCAYVCVFVCVRVYERERERQREKERDGDNGQ